MRIPLPPQYHFRVNLNSLYFFQFEQNRLSNRLPPGADARRLSDLNITIEPPSLEENDLGSSSDDKQDQHETGQQQQQEHKEEESIGLYPTNSDISEESSESYNDNHIASWIEGSLINSAIFKQENSSDDDDDNNEDDVSSLQRQNLIVFLLQINK